jgi:hypothetical protein
VKRPKNFQGKKKNPSCCNLQAEDNEPINPATTPESHGLGPVIPIARNVAAEGRLSYFKRFGIRIANLPPQSLLFK